MAPILYSYMFWSCTTAMREFVFTEDFLVKLINFTLVYTILWDGIAQLI